MKLLVTGGAGFIGANFLEVAAERFEIPFVIDARTYASDFSRVSDKHRLIRNDIRLVPWAYFLDGNPVDAIINFAAETHVDNSIDSSQEFIESNYLGVHNILEGLRTLKSQGKKVPFFVQISTDEVYGDLSRGDPHRFTEEDILRPSNPYAATKAAADLLIQSWGRTYGIPYAICRAANNYGKYQHAEKLLPTVVRKALANEKIPVYGDGKNIREWLHTRDFADGICKVIEAYSTNPDDVVGEIFNFGANMGASNLYMVRKILEFLGKDESLIEFVEDRPGHDRKYSLDFDKAGEVLGWWPTTEFSTGLEETVKSLRAHFE